MSQFTAREKMECADREVRLRVEVYQRYNRMPTAEKLRQIALMKEIADDYRALARRDELPLDLKS